MFRLRITGDLGFEFWQDIPGYEGLYQASTYGRIKRLAGYYYCGHRNEQKNIVKESILSFSKNHKGYYQVRLSDGKGKRNGGLVHRFIAITFLPKWKKEYNQINHKSEVKTENQVWNLEWCTNRYNINYGSCITRASEKRKKQIGIFENGILVYTCFGAKEAAAFVKRDKSCVIHCALGDYKTANGYTIKYIE